MRTDREGCYDSVVGKLTTLANWVVRVIGVAIFLWLTWYAFRYTQYCNPGEAEIPVDVRDSMGRNLLGLGLAVLMLFGAFWLERKVPARMQLMLSRITLVISMLWIAAAGFWWITAADRQPVADQAYVYGGASLFIEGNYVFLEPKGYCGMCPHQLSLIFLVELLFRLVGTYNYFACQVICVLISVGIVFLGYRLVSKITGHLLLTAAYNVLMMACLPMIFYTGWVYGDVPGVFFILMAANFLLDYEKKGQLRYLVGIVLSMSLAIMVRENCRISLIALCLVGGIYVLQKKDKRLAVTLAVAFVCPILINAAVYKMYEVRSGYEHIDGLSPYSYIAMGLREEDGKCGWYSEYSKRVYWDAGCDTKLAGDVSKTHIKERLREFINNPGYGYDFFKRKILSQWNEPLYQSLYFSNEYFYGKEPDADSAVVKLSTDYFVDILAVCDRLQFIMYAGMICYFLFAVKRDSNILQHFLAVGIIGGFFFSILWEAMARYTLPYYLMMYPLAIVGYWNLFRAVTLLINRFSKNKSEDNIIEFRRVA